MLYRLIRVHLAIQTHNFSSGSYQSNYIMYHKITTAPLNISHFVGTCVVFFQTLTDLRPLAVSMYHSHNCNMNAFFYGLYTRK